MEIKQWNGSQNDLMRIIQESVPGKQITMAHIIASPDQVIYKKLGLDPRIDYNKAAIGVLTQTPSETAIITADLALKAARTGGTAGAILNGANEAAVALFLEDRIGFLEIADRVALALDRVPVIREPSMTQILEADQAAREAVLSA